ncbi:MAG: hypothetical protein KDJ52_14380, partial [Anaerolineae bacterium]|nr:hypothetical protein [Anaerolineae bacterium]
QNNGGSTPTLLPSPSSPAVDAGDPTFSSPPTFDQRGTGFERVFDILDIGAVERQSLLLYYPLLLKNGSSSSDLVITHITATSSDVLVTIKNQGSTPVTDAFWVDVYYNLDTPPVLNQQGSLFWGLSQANGGVPIAAGQSVTLSLASPYYYEGNPPASGTKVHGQVDSVGTAGVGGVAEANESNNVFGAMTSTSAAVAASTPSNRATDYSGLPNRMIVTLSSADTLPNPDITPREAGLQRQDDNRLGQGWQALLRPKSFDTGEAGLATQHQKLRGGRRSKK